MNVFYSIREYQAWYKEHITPDISIGLVSTKGCLHKGHLVLAQIAASHCNHVVLSVSLHPNQFEGEGDFERFPRIASQDIALASESGSIDVLLLLRQDEYLRFGPKNGAFVWMEWDLLPAEKYWNPEVAEAEGTMLVKVLNISRATHLYLGGNDLIRSRMLQRILADLLYPVDVMEIPVVRDEHDIAYDARLHALPEEQRSSVAVVYRALRTMVQLYLKDVFHVQNLLDHAQAILETEPQTLIKMIFCRVAHPYGFHDIETIDPAIGAVAIIKVIVAEKTTHLDNVILAPKIPAKEKRLIALVKRSPPR